MYSWSFNVDVDSFVNGNFESIEDCVADAKKSWNAVGFDPTYNRIYVGKVVPVQIKNLVNFFELLEHIEINMTEETPYAEDWDISTIEDGYIDRRAIYNKYEKKLEQLVEDYIKEIDETPHFSTLENIQEISLLDYMNKKKIVNILTGRK